MHPSFWDGVKGVVTSQRVCYAPFQVNSRVVYRRHPYIPLISLKPSGAKQTKRMTRALGKKVGQAGVLLVLGRFFVRILGFLSTIVIARLLTPEDFAFVALAMVTLAVVQGITGVQFDKALVQDQTAGEAEWSTAWTLNMLRGVLIFLVVFLFGPLLFDLLGYGAYQDAVQMLALVPLFAGLKNPKVTIFFRDVDMRFDVLASLVQKVSSVVITIWLAYELGDYRALLVGVILGTVMETSFTYVLLPFRPRVTVEKTRKLWSFSGWMMGAGTFNVIGYNLDHFLIAATLGTRMLGLYRVSVDLIRTPLQDFAGPLAGGLFPAFAQMQDEPARLKAAFRRSMGVLMSVVVPITFGLALVAADLIPLLLGAKWADAIPFVQIMAPIEVISILSLTVGSLMMATAKTKTLFLRTVMVNLVRIPAIIIGIKMAGVTGILIAHGVASLFSAALNLGLTRRFADFGFMAFLGATYRTWLSAFLMVVAVFLFQQGFTSPGGSINLATPLIEPDLSRLVGSILLGAISYGVSHLALWRIAGSPNDSAERDVITQLSPLINRFRQRP